MLARAVETGFIALLPLFSLFFIWQSTLVTGPPRTITVGPKTVPLLIGWLMLGVSAVLLVQRIRTVVSGQPKPASEVESDDGDTRISDWPAVWTVLGAFLALVLLFEFLGFVLAASLFIFGTATLFARRQWILNLVSATGFGITFYLLFSRVLGIQLPKGLLEFLP